MEPERGLMKRLFVSAAILVLTTASAFAAEPSVIGDWQVKEGYGHVRIDNCVFDAAFEPHALLDQAGEFRRHQSPGAGHANSCAEL